MLDPSVRQCGSCCFSRQIAGRLHCIRNPPTADPATGHARWPQVAPTDHCGVYSPKPRNRASSLVTRDSQDPNDAQSPDPQSCHREPFATALGGLHAAISIPATPGSVIARSAATKQSQPEITPGATAAATPHHKSQIANHTCQASLPVFVDAYGPYCKIPLTQGRFAKVDPQDYPWLAQFRWCLKVNVDNCYAVRTVQIKGKSKRIYMHRQIMNTPADRVCDHINHDGLDNRRTNCRNCNVAQNNAHRRKRATPPGSPAPTLRDTNNEIRDTALRATDHAPRPTGHGPRPTSSQYIGVSRDRRRNKWVAHMKTNGRPKYLGAFDIEEDAARTRDQAAWAQWREYAHLNFPDDYPEHPENKAVTRWGVDA